MIQRGNESDSIVNKEKNPEDKNPETHQKCLYTRKHKKKKNQIHASKPPSLPSRKYL